MAGRKHPGLAAGAGGVVHAGGVHRKHPEATLRPRLGRQHGSVCRFQDRKLHAFTRTAGANTSHGQSSGPASRTGRDMCVIKKKCLAGRTPRQSRGNARQRPAQSELRTPADTGHARPANFEVSFMATTQSSHPRTTQPFMAQQFGNETSTGKLAMPGAQCPCLAPVHVDGFMISCRIVLAVPGRPFRRLTYFLCCCACCINALADTEHRLVPQPTELLSQHRRRLEKQAATNW